MTAANTVDGSVGFGCAGARFCAKSVETKLCQSGASGESVMALCYSSAQSGARGVEEGRCNPALVLTPGEWSAAPKKPRRGSGAVIRRCSQPIRRADREAGLSQGTYGNRGARRERPRRDAGGAVVERWDARGFSAIVYVANRMREDRGNRRWVVTNVRVGKAELTTQASPAAA